MRVHIDKARRDHPTARVDACLRLPMPAIADTGNALAGNGNIRALALAAAAVDQPATFDKNITGFHDRRSTTTAPALTNASISVSE